MKFSKIILATLPFMLMACDEVSMSNRFIELEAIEPERKVLLEEFTGQTCTNCPDAHRVIQSLEEQYGEDLIVVSIHAGNFGIASPYGLMQKEGDDYANRWGIETYPAGVVDRQGGKLNYEDFATAVRAEIGKSTSLEMELEAQLSEDGKNIEIFTTMISPVDLQGSLQVWVIESGIVAVQIDNGKIIQDYVHNNVFRACVNGLWGESIPIEKNIAYYPSYSIAIDDSWVVENLSIVAFYYNNGGVMQVEKCDIGPAEEPDIME